MLSFIVQCGLTRRLVEAQDVESAQAEFLKDVPIRRFFGDLDEVLDVRVATEDEIRDFQSRHRRAAQFDDQIALDLNDMRKEAAARRSKKEPS